MKQSLFHFLGNATRALGTLSLAFFFAVPALAQETIAYPGFPLQFLLGYADSLAPSGSGTGKSNSLSGNSVTLNSGAVGDVHGGINLNDADPATNNRVFIKGGSVSRGAEGGHGVITSTGNSGTVSGGTVNGNINGGHTLNGDAALTTAIAADNSVTISGGTVNCPVYGGYSDNPVTGGTATAKNNTVTIRGTPTFGDNVRLYGGFANGDVSSVSTGNTLNFHSAELKVHEVYFFQNMNFYLPSTLAAGGTALTVTEAADIAGVTIKVGFEGAGPALQSGNRYILIAAGTLHGDFQPVTGTLAGYAYTVAKEGNSLVLTIGARQFVPGPTKNYNGQWVSADGEGEWGLTVLTNFSDSRYIFVPWYTYDKSGKASWYVFQGPVEDYGAWTANDTFEANVYRYKGPKWNTHGSYNNAECSDAVVGTVKLTFTSATTAKFKYTVEGEEREINLERLWGAPGAGWDYKYTGQWSRSGEKQWGLTVLMTFPVNPKYIFVPWYTYDNNGNAQWYLFQGADDEFGRWTSDNVFEGEVRRYTGPAWDTHGSYDNSSYDNSKIDYKVVGTAKLTFDSPTTAKFEYNVDNASRTVDLVKLE